MRKKELIKKILENRNRITENLPDETVLHKLKKDELIKSLNILQKFRLVEVMTLDEAEGLIPKECKNCKTVIRENLNKNIKVLLGMDYGNKWHIAGVCC